MTVTVLGGTPVATLAAALAEHGQECPLDPRDPAATVGGVLACGLSGHRRLRQGPVRDRVLEVRFLTGDGRIVKGGGPTVKNVTGYDLPRLFVGSLGTLGVIVQVTLRTQPKPACSSWAVSDATPSELRRRLFRPACLVAGTGAGPACCWKAIPTTSRWSSPPSGWCRSTRHRRGPPHPHRGRVSVPPAALEPLASATRRRGLHMDRRGRGRDRAHRR